MMLHWGPELITVYNDGYAPSLGNKHPGHLGSPAKDWWPEMWDQLTPIFEQVLAGKPFFVEDARYTPERNGSPHEAFFTHCHSPLWDDDGRIAGIFLVVTETTRGIVAERKLAEVNADLERLVLERTAERDRLWHISRDPFLIADAQGIWLSASPVWTEILGWSEAELLGRTSAWMEHPEDHDRTRAKVLDIADGDIATRFENRFRGRDGSYRWFAWTAVEDDGRLYCVARDVTVAKASAAALRLFANIVQSDEAPILAYDHDLRVIGFNRAHKDAFIRVMGQNPEAGDLLPDQFPPEQAILLRGFMERALSGETFSVVEKFGNPRHEEPTWEITYSPLRDEDGTIFGAFHVARDIRERVRAQEELIGTQEALRQSQKMEAVGQLTGGLAHDFNNLLAVITGGLDLMERRISQNRIDQLGKFIDAAQTAARRAAALTHRLLAFSRRQTLDPKPTNVSRMAEDMQDMIDRTVGPEIVVAIVPNEDVWTTLVDPNQLENALLNLCINARDAMPDGGRITIEIANIQLADGPAALRDMPPGQYIALSVSDIGTGMPPDVVARVFEPFYTTKPIGRGTGLGLSMVYGFAKQSEGQVRIHSEVGHGTAVTIYLPRSLSEVVIDQAGAAATPDRAAQSRTVLVVDDEDHIRMLIADVLEDLGCEMIEADSGQAALKLLKTTPRIDLLITDVGMPGGMNGRQLADAARLHRPALKILFITGYAEIAVLSHGYLEPGMAVLTKPFAIDVLANRVKDMIEPERLVRDS